MSLNKTFYETFKSILACNLVTRTSSTEVDMKEFETLLNNAQPSKELPLHGQYELARAMYKSNPRRYLSYITRSANNVSALILWTESKHIVDYFGLRTIIYLTWNRENNKYIVLPYNKQYSQQVHDLHTNNTEQSHMSNENEKETNNKVNIPVSITQRRGGIIKKELSSKSYSTIGLVQSLPSTKWSDIK